MSTVIEVRSCFISSEKLQYIFIISKPHRAFHDQDHADHIDEHQSTDRSVILSLFGARSQGALTRSIEFLRG